MVWYFIFSDVFFIPMCVFHLAFLSHCFLVPVWCRELEKEIARQQDMHQDLRSTLLGDTAKLDNLRQVQASRQEKLSKLDLQYHNKKATMQEQISQISQSVPLVVIVCKYQPSVKMCAKQAFTCFSVRQDPPTPPTATTPETYFFKSGPCVQKMLLLVLLIDSPPPPSHTHTNCNCH